MLSSTNCCPHRVIGTEERKTCYQAQSVRVSNELLWQRLGKCAINHKVLLSPMCCCDKREKHVINHKALLSLTSCDRREKNMLSSTKRCCLRRVVMTKERETCYQAQNVVVDAIKHKMQLSTLSSTVLLSTLSDTQCCCPQHVLTDERDCRYQDEVLFWQSKLKHNLR